VLVDGVEATDMIRVYAAASGGTPIGAAAASGTSVTVFVNQLGTGAGSVYVTVTKTGAEESTRTLKAYGAEPLTPNPLAANITVVNNVAGRLDVVTVSGLLDQDIVRVYQKMTGAVLLATAVSGGDTATLYVHQLGLAAGSVYVTVQRAGMIESGRTAAGYESETSAQPAAAAVTVQNIFYTETAGVQDDGTEDIVTVTGVAALDIIKVYKAASGADTWAAPATAAGESVTFEIPQLGTKAGKIFVTVTKPGKAESKRTAVPFTAEPVTPPLTAARVTVTNNYSAADTVAVTGLTAGDIIRVYATATSESALGTGTAAGNTVTVSIDAGTLSAAGGFVYVTVTTPGANESIRTAASFGKEAAMTPPPKANITVTNIFGPNDTVTVSSLTAGDVIKVYSIAKGGAAIGTGTAAAAELTVTLTEALLPNGGTVYVTVSSGTAGESARTAMTYAREPVADPPPAANITVNNNYAALDTIVITGLSMGDVIKVYAVQKGGESLGDVTATDSTATVSLADGKLLAAGGKLYVSLTTGSANEGGRTMVTYAKEPTTDAPLATAITVVNNFGSPDTITVNGLTAGDLVKVYKTATTATVIGTVTADDVSESFELIANGLTYAAGKVYVSVRSPGENESARTAVSFTSEKTTAPTASSVTVVNRFYSVTGGVQDDGTEDSVTVSGIEAGDIVKVYKAAGGTDTWAVSAPAAGESVTFEIPQLGTKAGKIFVTVTKTSKAESARTAVAFSSEPVTTAPTSASITVVNNYNDDDTVVVRNLAAGQTVTLYATQTGPAPLDTAVATGDTLTFSVDNGLLTAGGGKLFVTVKDPTKLESNRTMAAYTSEVSAPPKTGNILIVNNAGAAFDTITIVGLTPGDTVTVYDAATGGNELASETVASKGTTITLTTNLTDAANKVWVTITSPGKAESKRVVVAYQAA
jgi:hypothetical protein